MPSTHPPSAGPAEDSAKIREFEARIARGESIEPKDWMPERYRKQLVRMMSQHAHSEIVATLANGTPAQREMVQDAVNRWWWPTLMMFGPHDGASSNSDELLRWRVKRFTNDQLRQRFVNLTVPQAQAVNLTLPDPELRYDAESENWIFGEIDWDEFWQVVKGDGPCNRERLAARNKAHADGAWVRAAAEAYAAKHAPNATASSEAAA